MNSFYTVSLFMVLAVISPGPDFIVLTNNAMKHGRLAGILTAIGIATGAIILSLASVFGLSALVKNVPIFFTVIKYAGSAYLFYLGVKSLFFSSKTEVSSNSVSKGEAVARKGSLLKSYKEGLLTSVLNPKALIFFTALFTIIMKRDTHIFHLLGFAFEISFIYLVWFVCLSYLVSADRIQQKLNKVQFYVSKILGVLLILVAIHIIMSAGIGG